MNQFSDQETRSFIWFEDAQYDPANGFLPYYFIRRPVPSGTGEVEVSLVAPVYELLDMGSTAILGTRASELGAEAAITSYVTNSRENLFANIRIVPIRRNPSNGQVEKLVSFNISVTPVRGNSNRNAAFSSATTSVLSSGTWYKIGVVANGVHKIDYNFLNSLGIDMSSLDPRNLRIYSNGRGQLSFNNNVPHYDDLKEYSIQVQGESDGSFDQGDYILFFGVSPNTWAYDTVSNRFHHHIHDYSDTTYYFLNTDLGSGKRISFQSSVSATPTHVVTSFDDYLFHERENENLIKSGREWYGEKFDVIGSYSFGFNFPNIDVNSAATVEVDMISRYGSSHTYSVSAQTASSTVTVGAAQMSCYYCPYAIAGHQDMTFTPNSPLITVSINRTINSSGPPTGWLNWIEVNARREMKISGSQMIFRDVQSVGAGNISEFHLNGFTSSSVVWDVSDHANPVVQQVGTVGNDLVWTLPTDTLKEFITFDGSMFNIPQFHGSVTNQNLHGLDPVDYIIVTHPNFMAQAQELAQLHFDHDSLSSVIVTPQQIYNEFSAGAQDVTAIRDFVRMLYYRAGSPAEQPKYLLLLGDGSYDNKNRLTGNTNYIPTFQNRNALGLTESYVSDEFYGLLNDSGEWDTGSDIGDCDIGIGRFPVQSASEAQAIVDKIRFYMMRREPVLSSSVCADNQCGRGGEWRNNVTFVGDDEDSNIHMSQSDQLATMVDTGYQSYNVDKIYLDAYQQEQTPGGERYPTVNEAINRKMDKGSLILNYTGHGGEVGLAHERVIEVQQINGWSNLCNMPLFVTATCEFSRYDDPARTSAGEYVLLNPNGGGIGLFTTVRLVYSTPNFILNRNFYRTVFEPLNGEMPRIGDVYRITKDISGNSTNNRNFTLLGDPALKLNYPENNVVTTEINGVPVSSVADTIKALSRVTVKGYVADTAGNIMSGFNGILYPTVYDKPATITTLQNDPPNAAFVYKLQKNALYHGKVSVVNGYFEFSFVVPKDISYQYGIGRISYYAENGVTDASGSYENIIVGGSNPNAPADNTGPQVKLFLNDSNFVNGGITNSSPRLFAVISDSNGVNTVGNGIGHDIVAVLDGETDNAVVLNDYYQSDINSYQRGTIVYPFSDLSEGYHTLSLKVWDVYNNSTTVTTEFYVKKDEGFQIERVLNYPNPFTTNTSFFFEHNQCCTDFDAMIQVFTVSGKLVKTIQQRVFTEGYRSEPIEWDGTDDYGDRIGRGVYIYRISVRTADGLTAERYEKLVIL